MNHPFVCQMPFSLVPRAVKENQREIGTYVAGALFAVGWWFFVDGMVFSTTQPNFPVRVGVEDYLPGIFCTIGMLVTNSIDLSLLRDDHFGYSGGSSLAGRAKFTLFIGIALIAGGLAGSIASLAIKYIVSGVTEHYIYAGMAVILQTVLITLSSMLLWVIHNSEAEGQYNFVLD
ncbi:Vacuolar protein sorting-associated protein 68 [Dimargaris xerosporica]|nr:Vacuolar protein sorting-associated protein 68 [Dimargaris xerosporica]